VQLAAVSLYAKFEDTTPEEFSRIIDTNLKGQAYGAMAALPYLRRSGGGALIHVSSVEARRGLPYQGAYASSKHGIKGFLDALRVELKKDGAPISVTEIMPASINTPLFEKARTRLGVMPMGMPPIYEPQLVAEAIAYAAEHPVREYFVGTAGKLIALSEKISPALTDEVMLRFGFDGQRTDIQKWEHAPDNMYDPLPGYARVRGVFTDQSSRTSAVDWAERNPWGARALAAIALVAAMSVHLRRSSPAFSR
jgi:hypothetical protein